MSFSFLMHVGFADILRQMSTGERRVPCIHADLTQDLESSLQCAVSV